jgi:thiosulfate/3-mercaptopyruvate sulfurtransferase
MLTIQTLAPLMISMALGASPQDAVDADGFANPELLVTTAWLAEHGADDGVVVVDVRSSKDFEIAHVPGAVSIPSSATYDPAVRGNIGSKEQVAALLGAQGIAATSHVVLYDGGRSTAAARVFWTLEVYGHARVSVVDGGLAKWLAEERATSTEHPVTTPVEYAVGSRPERLSELDQLLEDVEAPDVVMLDARSSGEYEAGRIPAAVRIEWLQNYSDDEVPVFRSPAELRKLYADQGVTSDKRVHAY